MGPENSFIALASGMLLQCQLTNLSMSKANKLLNMTLNSTTLNGSYYNANKIIGCDEFSSFF